ncbi:porin [Candidatus Thioglobus sp.]|uniref:porin n=1 Tax=Candidatus Thioglobus sp. TaxID=2026721 RepID=UPI003D11D985
MNNKKWLLPLMMSGSFLALPASAVEFEFDDTVLSIKAKAYLWYANTDKGATSSKTLGNGGEKTEIEFKFKHKIDDTEVFGEIELKSDVFNDADSSGRIDTDDIVLGLKNPAWGQVSFSKNNDDPVEKYITEGLEGLGKFADVSEAATTSSRNNQLQYKTPDFSGFNVVLGVAQQSNTSSATDKADISYVVNYKGEVSGNKFGVSVGVGDTSDTDKTKGINAFYQIGNTKLILNHIKEDKDSETFQGFGVSHKFNKKHKLSFAYQKVEKTGSSDRQEKALSYQYQMFEHLKLYAEVARLDKADDKDDALGVGAKFSF